MSSNNVEFPCADGCPASLNGMMNPTSEECQTCKPFKLWQGVDYPCGGCGISNGLRNSNQQVCLECRMFNDAWSRECDAVVAKESKKHVVCGRKYGPGCDAAI